MGPLARRVGAMCRYRQRAMVLTGPGRPLPRTSPARRAPSPIERLPITVGVVFNTVDAAAALELIETCAVDIGYRAGVFPEAVALDATP